MAGFQPGSIFAGRYKIIRPLGEGGMGSVYLACDPHQCTFEVALKVLFPGVVHGDQAKQRFVSEMKMCQIINHPNVVKSYEHFNFPEMLAYAMEYIDGGDLGSRMRTRSITLSQAIDFIRGVANGLSEIHACGIVHRDLKPENVLITKDGIPKISDFGLARTDSSGTLTNVGAMVGTPQYVSPEYIELGECDRRADIYALGVISYEMITGRSPWGPDSGISALAMRNFSAFPPISKVLPACPEQLANVITRAMAPNLNVRYQSASEIIEGLDGL